MLKFLPLLPCLLALSLSCSSPLLAQATTVDGSWNVAIPAAKSNPKMDLVQKGNVLSGTFYGPRGDAPITGTIEGQRVNFTAETKGGPAKFDGVLEGNTMKGKANLPRVGASDWTAVKR
ncbi:MAG: hypothetical protein H7Y37_11175 [Anaerolineae bacterium]|nr:hypothetical protein [Gloeobacterales cyanobacterium ES-bin-313]